MNAAAQLGARHWLAYGALGLPLAIGAAIGHGDRCHRQYPGSVA